MKDKLLLLTLCPLLILPALVEPTVAQGDGHDHVYTGSAAYYLAEHGDFDIGFEGGQLELHVHLHAGAMVDGNSLAEDTTFEPGQLIVVATGAAEVLRPESTLWEPAGVDVNEPMWVLPQHEQEGLPAFGIATEDIDGGAFVDDVLTLTLRYIQGPGDFSLWQSDALGLPTFLFTTHDQIMTATFPIGVHAHCNWGFTVPGDYTLVFEVSGESTTGGSVNALSIYTFKVTDGPLCLAPVPGDVNGDGVVDERDMEMIVENFGATASFWPAD